MIKAVKEFWTFIVTAFLTIVTLFGYAHVQKKKANKLEKENEDLLVQNQGLVNHNEHLHNAIQKNVEETKKVEESISSGKRDYFESDNF